MKIERDDDQIAWPERIYNLKKFWTGKDVTVIGDQILYPTWIPSPESLQYITVSVDRFTGMPDIGLQNKDLHDFLTTGFVDISTRSRLAQLGGELYPVMDDEQIIEISDKRVLVKLPVFNHGNCQIILNEGDGVGCFYSKAGTEELIGTSLADALASEISISGSQGEDWIYMDEHMVTTTDVASARGLALRVSNNRHKISHGKPISIFSNEITDYRQFIEQNGLLVPIPPGEDESLWISETVPSVTIPEGYTGILGLAMVGDKNSGFGYVRQTMSLLMQGGRTNWPIRVEIHNDDRNQLPTDLSYSDDEDNKTPTRTVNFDRDPIWIFMELYKDQI